MAIDPSIPLQFRGLDLGQIMREAEQMKASREDRAFRQEQFSALRDERQAMREARLDEQKRANILNGARIIRKTKPQDEASWQATRAIAQQFGIPLDSVPENYDPQFIKGIIDAADALDPQQQEGYTLGPGDTRFGPDGRAIAHSPFRPQIVKDDEGNVYEFSGGGQPVGAGGGGSEPGPADFNGIMQNWLFPIEGGYVASDGRSGAPANYGINQKANPDIDVASLTPEKAQQIYFERYWQPSGAEQIENPALRAIHFDTAVNMGVEQSKQMLAQSGGDPAKYLELREQRYKAIGGPSLPVWMDRNQRLGQYAGSGLTMLVQGKGKKSYQMVSDQERESLGLAPGKYQRSPEGKIDPVGGSGGAETDPVKRETELRKEFSSLPEVKKFNEVRDATRKIRSLAFDIPEGSPGRAQADMGLIFSYMKALDPGSTVREGEYATAQNSAGVPERIRVAYNAALDGTKLSRQQRVGFVSAANNMYFSTAKTYNEFARRYHVIGRRQGIKDINILKSIAPLAVHEGPPPSAPKKQSALPAGWKIERVR